MVGIITWIVELLRKKKVDKQMLQQATQFIFFKQDSSDLQSRQSCKDVSQAAGSDPSLRNQVAPQHNLQEDPFDVQLPELEDSSSQLDQLHPATHATPFKPPKYLQDGDVVRIEIDGIGVLRNAMKAGA